MSVFVHPTARIEDGVTIGDDTKIWDQVHVRPSTAIGTDCIIGEKTYISYSVQIGNCVKINSFVYICTGVTIQDGVMISAGVIFTNDVYPRAATPELDRLLDSSPSESTGRTLVRVGATLGAGCIVGSNLVIGCFSLCGMGSVITRDVQDFHLCYGNPAKPAGYVCRCGVPLLRFEPGSLPEFRHRKCQSCGRLYHSTSGAVSELTGNETA